MQVASLAAEGMKVVSIVASFGLIVVVLSNVLLLEYEPAVAVFPPHRGQERHAEQVLASASSGSTSAATLRTVSPPTSTRLSSTGAALIMPLAVETLAVKSRGVGWTPSRAASRCAQRDHRGAGVDHEGHPAAVDDRLGLEMAVAALLQGDAAAIGDRSARRLHGTARAGDGAAASCIYRRGTTAPRASARMAKTRMDRMVTEPR